MNLRGLLGDSLEFTRIRCDVRGEIRDRYRCVCMEPEEFRMMQIARPALALHRDMIKKHTRDSFTVEFLNEVGMYL